MKVARFYESELSNLIQPGKVLAIYGPRRAGKTTLLKTWVAGFNGKYFFGNGEDSVVRNVLESGNTSLIRSSFAGFELVVIDEAQAVKNVGSALKMLVDELPGTAVIASGSSSFELAGQLGEPLTGRKRSRVLFPLSAQEIAAQFGQIVLRQRLEEMLVFGTYPEIWTAENFSDKEEQLVELTNDYLFKDILAYERVRNSGKLRQIVSLLAFQIGKEVSLNELSRSVGLSVLTIERYLDLLEKTFVIFRIPGFSRNLRSEITRSCRVYFWDNGILNAVLRNFSLPSLRNDMGALWENFLVSERIKRQGYGRIFAKNYFWRTYMRQEIDWIEDVAGALAAFEFKWSVKARVRVPAAWKAAYPDATFTVVSPENFTEFVC